MQQNIQKVMEDLEHIVVLPYQSPAIALLPSMIGSARICQTLIRIWQTLR
jgi:hypothetical protein